MMAKPNNCTYPARTSPASAGDPSGGSRPVTPPEETGRGQGGREEVGGALRGGEVKAKGEGGKK